MSHKSPLGFKDYNFVVKGHKLCLDLTQNSCTNYDKMSHKSLIFLNVKFIKWTCFMPESLKVSSGLRPCFTFSQILNCLVCPLWKCDCIDLLCRGWTWPWFIHVLKSGASCLSRIVCSGQACGFPQWTSTPTNLQHRPQADIALQVIVVLPWDEGDRLMEGLLPSVSVWKIHFSGAVFKKNTLNDLQQSVTMRQLFNLNLAHTNWNLSEVNLDVLLSVVFSR